MTLSSRHRIRNSSPGGLRPSTLPLGHGGSPQYWLSHVDGEETFLFLSNRRVREPNPELLLKCFRIPVGAEFSEKYHVSPVWILRHCYDVVSLGEALHLQFTQVKKRSWNGTRMNRSSDQDVRCKVGWYQTISLHPHLYIAKHGYSRF